MSVVRNFFAFLMACVFVSAACAQSLVEIEVRGNQRLGDDAVRQYMGLRAGDSFDRMRIRDDLRALYNTGLFKDVRMDVEEDARGLRLVVFVEEKDYIQKIIFEGNDRVSSDDIEKALDLKLPFLWDDILVRQSTEKIRKLYRDKGYYLVTMRADVIEEGRQKHLRFTIDEGSRVRVREVHLQGNERLSDERLLSAMVSRPDGFWSGLSPRGQFDEDLLVQVDSRRIQMEYLKRGFAFARVDRPSISFTPDRQNVVISYHIFEGDQYTVGDIRFAGDLDFIPDPEALRRRLSSQNGALWNFLNIQEDIQKIQDIYGDQGYAYANVSPSWVVADEENKVLDIEYRVEKGSIVYFGSIDIQGNFETLDRIIRRELEVAEGELFNITRYRESQQSRASGIFQYGEISSNRHSC